MTYPSDDKKNWTDYLRGEKPVEPEKEQTPDQKILEMHPQMLKEIKNNERILTLMQAGLKIHPEEADFVELHRYKLKEQRNVAELTGIMVQAIKRSKA